MYRWGNCLKIRNKKIFISNLSSTMAFTATLGGFLFVFVPLGNISTIMKGVILLLFVLINLCFSYYKSLPKKKITLRISEKLKVNVYFGDLFKTESNIIIPVNEYFDTLVDDKLISSRTLHGNFVKTIFGGYVQKLDLIIDENLAKYSYQENDTRQHGKTRKYPLGTTIHFEEKGKIYFLFALANFDDENKAYISKREYQLSLYKLLDYLHLHSQGSEVNIPLIGGGQSGVKLSKQDLLEYLLSSIKLHDDLTISGGINIVLHHSLVDDIDLNKIEFLYKYGGF